ncbi:unnamed protein product [Ilex paraguariensis]|uniref:DUF309 domain-containing protein n=1 Tax=Ilex paraguariensis TaxID=185542 RepID=A0ABC8RYY9_9AQUA
MVITLSTSLVKFQSLTQFILLPLSPSSSPTALPFSNYQNLASLSSANPNRAHPLSFHTKASHRYYSGDFVKNGDDAVDCGSFEEAVGLFNGRDYYRCHDYLEALWNKSQEPTRTLIHGILQCAVGFHHLFNQNHRGAMMELGEGLCKLRKMNFETGPFHQFEKDISAVLDFIYQTQLELAACEFICQIYLLFNPFF